MNTVKIAGFVSAAVAVAAVAYGQARPGFRILGDAPLDEIAVFPKEELVSLFREANANGIRTTRLLEGGEYNVNIRHAKEITPENFRTLVHPDTIDVWVVQEGSGTRLTGGRQDGDQHIGGDERFISVGDLVFIPAGMPHGMKETNAITWLNIRFPEHRN